MFETDQASTFGGDLPPLEVEGVAVTLVGGLVKLFGDVAVVVEITQLTVVGNITPHQILALSVPGRSFGPQTARIQTLDRCVADLGLETLGVDHDDIGVGIALRLGVAAKITGRCVRCYQRRGRDCCSAAQHTATVDEARCGFGAVI